MKTYRFKYFGSSTIQPLEFTSSNMNEQYAKDNVTRSLAHYWPTYYSAAMWDGDGKLIAEFQSEVVVKEVVR